MGWACRPRDATTLAAAVDSLVLHQRNEAINSEDVASARLPAFCDMSAKEGSLLPVPPATDGSAGIPAAQAAPHTAPEKEKQDLAQLCRYVEAAPASKLVARAAIQPGRRTLMHVMLTALVHDCDADGVPRMPLADVCRAFQVVTAAGSPLPHAPYHHRLLGLIVEHDKRTARCCVCRCRW